MSSELWRALGEKLRSEEGEESSLAGSRHEPGSNAIFTPTELVLEMVSGVPLEYFAPGKTVFDPACGDGQFLLAAKWIKMLHFEQEEPEALADIYGVDLDRAHVDRARQRVGGGFIVMGDALNPERRLTGQTEEEFAALQRILGTNGGHSQGTLLAA
jgi:SAM-dependent methyltransferase